MNFDPQNLAAMQVVATRGAPVVLQAAGRLLGLGQAEQDALVKGAVPLWLVLTVGLTAGWIGGVNAQSRGWAPGWLSSEK